VAKELRSTISESRQIVLELLFADLDLACTFLDTAGLSSLPDTRKRNISNALKAYHEISAKSAKIEMPDVIRAEIDAKLNELRTRLAQSGASV
jgi:hypothetical protein